MPTSQPWTSWTVTRDCELGNGVPVLGGMTYMYMYMYAMLDCSCSYCTLFIVSKGKNLNRIFDPIISSVPGWCSHVVVSNVHLCSGVCYITIDA